MPPILPARAPTRGDTNFGALHAKDGCTSGDECDYQALGHSSVAAELPLRAVRAVEREPGWRVVREVGPPTLLIRRQPDDVAFGAMNDEGNLLCAHGGEV